MICPMCSEEFTPHHHLIQYCPGCREYRRLHHYELLTQEQKRRYKAQNHHYMAKYRRLHPGCRRKQNREAKWRYNAEALLFATRSHTRWTGDEMDYLMRNALIMTARNIAFILERSYYAIIMRAFQCGIPLMTEDKRHGRLVTN